MTSIVGYAGRLLTPSPILEGHSEVFWQPRLLCADRSLSAIAVAVALPSAGRCLRCVCWKGCRWLEAVPVWAEPILQRSQACLCELVVTACSCLGQTHRDVKVDEQSMESMTRSPSVLVGACVGAQ